MEIIFEVSSAFGTVGLSLGVYTGIEYWWKDRYHDFDVYRENRNVYLLILYGRKTRKRILSLSKRANRYWIEKVNDPGVSFGKDRRLGINFGWCLAPNSIIKK